MKTRTNLFVNIRKLNLTENTKFALKTFDANARLLKGHGFYNYY
jgi:hypothetical protein